MIKAKYCVVCVLTVILIVMFSMGFYYSDAMSISLESISVEIYTGESRENISLWESKEGTVYCFLPSYVDLENAYLCVKSLRSVFLDDKKIGDGAILSGIELNRDYTLCIGGNNYTLQFVQSANVATMYIDTRSGSIKEIHANKENEEKINITLYDDRGRMLYRSERFNDEISGHGNSTWGYVKKSYNLKLSAAADLLEMGEGNKWVLLSNASDETNLRNKLVYDFSDQAGFRWTPKCKYVDLYLNGEYVGLYLLTEKIEVTEERLDISKEQGILLTTKQQEKWTDSTVGFRTDRGRDFTICWPKSLNDDEMREIEESVQQIENYIMENNIYLYDYIDLDSWARRYLVDEIFLNLDSEQASAYYYWTGLDNSTVMFAGPIWDYDFSLGNAKFPFWNIYSRLLGSERLYYNALMQNEAFRQRVIEIFRKEFYPLLIDMTDGIIDELSDQIKLSHYMNYVRWNESFPWLDPTDTSNEKMKQFLELRVEFLRSVWVNEDVYHSVIFNLDNIGSCKIYVKDNMFITQIDDIEAGADGDIIQWYDEAGEPFDLTQPITEDKVLYADVVKQE